MKIDQIRACRICGKPFRAAKYATRCPEHRQARTPIERTKECPECGETFELAPKKGRQFEYCERHRGVIGSRRRLYRQRGHVPRKQRHVCGERCARIQAYVESEHPPTLQAMGDEFGVTREMIRQIIVRHGWKKKFARRELTCKGCGGGYYGDKREHNATPEHQQTVATKERKRLDLLIAWDQVALIAAMWEAGYSKQEIIDLAGVFPTRVYRALRIAGLNPYSPGRGPQERLNPQQAAERDRQIALMWVEGVSTPTIMDIFGVEQGNLTRITKEQGVRRPDWYRKEHMDRMRAMAREKRREQLA